MPIGCYGKLPICGDFVAIGDIDGSFPVVREWLHCAFGAAMARLPEGWGAIYRIAPMWRFAASAGVFSPLPVLGLMSPSADRAGRLFPVVLIAESAASPQAWYDAAELLLLDVFAGNLAAVADFTERMHALDAEAGWDGVDTSVSAAAILALDALPGRVSAWWTQAQSIDRPAPRAFTSLPNGAHLVALFSAARAGRGTTSTSGEQGNACVIAPWTAGDLSADGGVLLVVFGASVAGLQALVNAAASAAQSVCLASLLALTESLHSDLSGWMDDLYAVGGPRPGYAGVAALRMDDAVLAVSIAGRLVAHETRAGGGNGNESTGGAAPRAFTAHRKPAVDIRIAIAGSASMSGALPSTRDRAALPEAAPGVRAGFLGAAFIVSVVD